MKGFVFAVLALAALASAEIYFQETFSDDKVMDRWVHSNAKVSEGTAGEMKVSAGKYFADAEDDKGLQTTQDSKFYMYTCEIPKEFSNKDKTLVFQYQLKQEQHIDCGGGYLKLLPADSIKSQKDFNADSKYNIMFGPDICGMSTRRTHVIFSDKEGKNHLIKKDVKCETDDLSHLYTLIVHGDAAEVTNRLSTAQPQYLDVVPLTLEEIFIYELGGADYAVKDILL